MPSALEDALSLAPAYESDSPAGDMDPAVRANYERNTALERRFQETGYPQMFQPTGPAVFPRPEPTGDQTPYESESEHFARTERGLHPGANPTGRSITATDFDLVRAEAPRASYDTITEALGGAAVDQGSGGTRSASEALAALNPTRPAEPAINSAIMEAPAEERAVYTAKKQAFAVKRQQLQQMRSAIPAPMIDRAKKFVDDFRSPTSTWNETDLMLAQARGQKIPPAVAKRAQIADQFQRILTQAGTLDEQLAGVNAEEAQFEAGFQARRESAISKAAVAEHQGRLEEKSNAAAELRQINSDLKRALAGVSGATVDEQLAELEAEYHAARAGGKKTAKEVEPARKALESARALAEKKRQAEAALGQVKQPGPLERRRRQMTAQGAGATPAEASTSNLTDEETKAADTLAGEFPEIPRSVIERKIIEKRRAGGS